MCNTRMYQTRNPQQQMHTPPTCSTFRLQPGIAIERHTKTTQQHALHDVRVHNTRTFQRPVHSPWRGQVYRARLHRMRISWREV
jgi:hypothetical protein